MPDDVVIPDKNIFTVDAKINRRNERWFANDLEDVPIVARTKFLNNGHMPGIEFSESDVIISSTKKKMSPKKFIRYF